jgi:outer membrane receptor protein involved in Fe transport
MRGGKQAPHKTPQAKQTAQAEGEEGAPADEGTEGEVELTPEELALLAQQEAEAEAEVIVVTGSAIERKELTTPAPVSVIDKADIDAAGLASVGDILQNLPSQSNAINVQFNNGGDGATRVDIRGLGSVRTLVLINGRRVVPGGTGADASVDLNAIPLAAIERVEVLKDGASAIYGSDAVGGVVNIITRDDFQGAEANLYTGTSQRGDGQTYDVSFITGASGKKSNVVFAGGYNEQKSVFAGDRAFATFDRGIDDMTICGDGQFGSVGNQKNFEAGADYELGTEDDGLGCTLVNGGSSAPPGGFLITDLDGDGMADPGNALWDSEVAANCPTTACTRDATTGEWRDFNFGDENGNTDFYNFQPENYLYTPARKYNLFSVGHYDFTEHVRAFYEGLYTHRFSRQQLAAEPLFLDQTGLVISQENQFNPYGLDIVFYRRRLTETGDRAFEQNVDSFRSVIGIEGDMPDDSPLKTWKWELSFNYGRTVAQQMSTGSLISSRLGNAIGPSFQDADGNWHCGTAAAPGPEECVPLNLLGGNGSITPEQAKYLTFTGQSTGFNEQKTLLAQAHGQLVKLGGGGDISAAFGADYRHQSGAFSPDPLTATGDTTGNAIEPTSGAYHVSEGFVEVSAVPVVGKTALQWLELDGAARFFQYNLFDDAGVADNFTYKAGALARTVAGIAFRGTFSTAFRAPSVGELFSGKFDNFPSASDPCDQTAGPIQDPQVAQICADQGVPDGFQNAISQVRTQEGGNPGLEAESANILTAGIVWEPPQVKGLSLTLDYFQLVIDNAVQSEGVSVILGNCYVRNIQAECDKIHRVASTHVIDYIDDSLYNVGGNETSGLDFSIAYQHDVGNAGTFRHQLEGTYLLKYNLETADRNQITDEPVVLEGRGVYDLGVYPYLKMNFASVWGRGPAGVGLNIRYIGGYSECNGNDCLSTTFTDNNGDGTPDVESIGYHARRHVDYNVTSDLWANYVIKTAAGTTTAAIGVNNILDQDPPYLDNGFLADSDASTYDYLGRYFYLRLTQAF